MSSSCRSELPSLIATASNTWGLLILTLLLGYGLVEVPLTLWNASRRKHTLNHCYFKAAKLYTDMAEADENLKEITEVCACVCVCVCMCVNEFISQCFMCFDFSELVKYLRVSSTMTHCASMSISSSRNFQKRCRRTSVKVMMLMKTFALQRTL